jgi:hypothetical protein
MVERMNRTIKDMLSKYVKTNQTDWDRFLDGIVLAYNTTPHETTQISPYRLVFGKEAKLPINIMTEDEKNITSGKEENRAVYVRELQEKLTAIHELARENTKKSSQRQKNYFDRNVRETNYEVGQLVRRSQPKVGKGEKLKLARKWTGPWVIVKRLSEVLYQIQHSKQSKPVIVHADNIKQYRGERQASQYTNKTAEYTSDRIPGASDRRVQAASDQRLKLPPEPQPKSVPAARKKRLMSPTDIHDSLDQQDQSLTDSQSEIRTKTTRGGREIRRPIRYRNDM